MMMLQAIRDDDMTAILIYHCYARRLLALLINTVLDAAVFDARHILRAGALFCWRCCSRFAVLIFSFFFQYAAA